MRYNLIRKAKVGLNLKMKNKKAFIKRVENFTCEVCGSRVKGNGYTDHCPNCLWSKHVDISPGDRRSSCQGLMEPLAVTKRNGEWQIFYRCQKCGYERFNKIAPEDNLDEIIRLSTQPVRPTILTKIRSKHQNYRRSLAILL